MRMTWSEKGWDRIIQETPGYLIRALGARFYFSYKYTYGLCGVIIVRSSQNKFLTTMLGYSPTSNSFFPSAMFSLKHDLRTKLVILAFSPGGKSWPLRP
jgi:hypothetical protein